MGRTVLLVALAVLLAATLGGAQEVAADGGAVAGGGGPRAARPAVDDFRSAPRYEPAPLPVRLRLPVAQVDTGLEPLGRAADGSVVVPVDPAVAGWYADGPRPGQLGPAVVLGHVDTASGPAVFYRLAGVPPGAEVHVDRADGSTVTFRVTEVLRVPKSQFPTDLVYSPTLQPSLRLVTCGGTFDRATGSYRDNVIVSAVPA